jgi:hypothetical protein
VLSYVPSSYGEINIQIKAGMAWLESGVMIL